MVTLMFVPGAFHGAWCFDRLLPILHGAGLEALAIDLPGTGRGAHLSPPPTQEIWMDHVAQALMQLGGPAIVVGHSRGGIAVSLLAERCPDRVALGVYLCAALLPDGTVPLHGMLAASNSGASTGMDELPDWLPVPPFEATLHALFNMCSEADARDAYSRLSPEPVAPMRAEMHLSDGRFGRVPRAYIECLRDNAVPIDQQRAMQRSLPCDIVETMDTDHSPFLSAPAQLADVMLRIVRRHRDGMTS